MITQGTVTVADLITRARLHHPTFGDDRHPNRLLLERISTRQRELLQDLADNLMDRISESRQVAAVITGALVGVDENGSAYSISTSGDGYDVLVDAITGALYLGPIAIALDPMADGFPLPASSLEIVQVYALLTDSGRLLPVRVVPQRDIARRAAWGDTLFAIIDGWRLVPIRGPSNNTGPSLWDRVSSVTVTWVDTPTRYALTGDWGAQLLVLPDIYAEALEYDLAAFLARRQAAVDKDFPASFLKLLTEEGAVRLAKAQANARRDHAPLRHTQVRRNR